MNRRSMERFVTLRTEIQDEINEIDTQVLDINEQINQLHAQIDTLNGNKEQLTRVLDGGELPTEEEPETEEPETEELKVSQPPATNSNRERTIAFLKDNPGIDRRSIQEALGINDSVIQNIMRKLREQDLVENRGTKRHAAWYLVS